MRGLLNAGSLEIKNHIETLNSIDIFPTPSGSAGTRIHLTLLAGCEAINQQTLPSASEVAHTFAHASLMGARGHQGVPFAQWFRGFARGLGEKSTVNATDFANAMSEAAATAHRTYIRPIEGEMWTVAKEAAEEAERTATDNENICQVLQVSTIRAKYSVENTAQSISLLQEMGVVHSGSLALFFFFNGMCRHLGTEFIVSSPEIIPKPEVAELIRQFNSRVYAEAGEN